MLAVVLSRVFRRSVPEIHPVSLVFVFLPMKAVCTTCNKSMRKMYLFLKESCQ